MQSKDRQKMCINCDGRIPFDAHVCPYCAAEQLAGPTSQGSAKEVHHQSLQDSLTALYSPPYSGKTQGLIPPSAGKNEVPHLSKPQPLKEPMAEKRFNTATVSPGTPTIPVHASEDSQADEGRTSFWPILLLSLGANLLMLGLLQLFFSDNGRLSLEWDSSLWFVYCLAALPLFFFGFKKVNTLKS